MTRLAVAHDLETAAACADILRSDDFAEILRHAAQMLKDDSHIELDRDVEDAVAMVAAGTGSSPDQVVRTILMEWLRGHGYLAGQDGGKNGAQ